MNINISSDVRQLGKVNVEKVSIQFDDEIRADGFENGEGKIVEIGEISNV